MPHLHVPFSLSTHPRRLAAAGLLVLLGAVSSCVEDPTATGIASQGGAGQNQPATPPPQSIASPTPLDAAHAATPTPLALASPAGPASPLPVATPVTVPSPSPSPGSSVSPSPTTSPTPTPDPSASASAAPTYRQTGVSTDVAISGPGYFVLSTKRDPAVLEDLFFTRHGHFKVEKETVSGLAMAQLKHATTGGFYVLGYARAGSSALAPDETAGINEAVLTTTWSGATVEVLGVAIDAERNPEFATKLSFGATGNLKVQDATPRGGDGNPMQAFVALAQFEHPDALVAVPGFTGFYRYGPNAGRLHLGVAYSGANRPVGNANLIKPGQLEGGN